MSSPVVITGIGVVSPNGVGCEAFTDALRQGKSGIGPITSFDAAGLSVRHAASAKELDPRTIMEDRDLRRVPRLVPLALAAAREAMRQAQLPPLPACVRDARNMAVMLGTGGGGLEFLEAQYRTFFTGSGKLSPFAVTAGTHGNLSSELSIALGLRGPSHVITTGCASSTDALGYAMMHIRSGTAEVAVAGGADAPITEGILRGFELMRIVAPTIEPIQRTSRPFCKDRAGFVLGEGAWMFVLETAAHAAERGVQPLAELCGWGSTCDAFHRVQPAPDAAESARAMTLALQQAGVAPEEVEYVNLHGTSTQLNDSLETLAIKQALGKHAYDIPMSSTKSMIGHPQGACGAAGLAATILSLQSGFVHPTINLDNPDPQCDLNYTANTARPTQAKLALCNCIAFGSKNSALVVKVL